MASSDDGGGGGGSARADDLHPDDGAVSENTPLLSRADSGPDQSQPHHERSAEDVLRSSLSPSGKASAGRRRWPSILALVILCLVATLIMVFAFFAPTIVEQYATSAAVFEPSSVSIDSFTGTGVRARVRGDFTVDARRVRRKAVRDLGVLATWIAREAESGRSEVEISLPEYGNVVLGTAHVPGILVDVRNGRTTHVDFLADLEPGSRDGLRRIATDWIDGRLGQLRVVGRARVPIKSGIFSLGTQTLVREVVFANDAIPSIPEYSIRKLLVHEMDMPAGRGVAADVSLDVQNDFPLDLSLPGLGFQILVGNCREDDPYIQVAHALTRPVHIQPKRDVEVNVTGIVRRLPDVLTQDCPDSKRSPLDVLVGRYMRGESNTVYVRGSESTTGDTPAWVGDLISDITVPVPLPGRSSFGHLIKNFSLADTHFTLPDPFATPDSPESNPRISGLVRALVALPDHMNFNLSARRVRADADVFYDGSQLGTLDLDRWQPANTTRLPATDDDDDRPALLVESRVDEAPLHITDEAVFTDVIQALVFGGKRVVLHIKANIDVEVDTALGEFKIRRVPAEGEVPVKRRS